MPEANQPLHRRLLRAVTSSMYARGVVLIGQIGLVPVLATGWGRAGYGEWVALTAAASYASYSGLGLAPTIRGDMSMAHARGGVDHVRPTFQTAIALLGATATVAMLTVLVVTHLVPIASLLNLTVISPSAAVLVVRLLALQLVFLILNGGLAAGLAACGGFAFGNNLDATRQALEFVSIAASVALLHAGPQLVSEIYVASAAATTFIYLGALHHYAPTLFRGAWRPRLEVLRRMWRPTLGGFAMNFGYNGLMIQAPRVVLASLAGPSVLASYAVCVMLLRVVRIPLEVPGVALSVEIARAFGTGNLQFVRRMLGLSTRSTFWLALLAVPFVVFLGPSVIQIWSNGRLFGDRQILVILSLSTCAFAGGLPSFEALISANRLMVPSAWLSILAFPFLAGCWVCAIHFGVEGVAAAVAVFEAAMALVLLMSAMREFEISAPNALGMFAAPTLAHVKGLTDITE